MTDLEELFQDAAAFAEQGEHAPSDPVGQVARARVARRRRQWTMIGVPAAAAVAVVGIAVAASLLPLHHDGAVATRDASAPTAFVALVSGRAGTFDAEDGHRIRDFGPARAIATAPDGVWTSSGTGCRSVLRFFHAGQSSFLDAEIPIEGYVGALAISPQGRTLAFTVAREKQEPTAAGKGRLSFAGTLPCGTPDLIVRDARTGMQRTWDGTADSGDISQLAWSADGTTLAFQTTVCCDASVTLHVLNVDDAMTPVTQVPSPRTDNPACRYTLPAFKGDTLLAVRQCDDGTELVGIGTAKDETVQSLPFSDPVALAVADKAVLISKYGTDTTPGELVRIDPDGTQVPLGTGFSQPTWAAPGSTEPTAEPTDTGLLTPMPEASPAPQASTDAAASCTYRSTPQARRWPTTTARDVGLPPSTPTAPPAQVTIHTNRGDITLSLRAQTPCTVNSFTHLIRNGYYDDTPCHRLTTAGIYVLQCGDPSGQGTGGPGYTFDDEALEGTTYPAGTVGMANSGPGTNGSQFFLVYKDTQLDPNYTVFGHITAGLDVLAKIAAGGSTPAQDGKPNLPVQIASVTLR
jgi:peptidyl-prolyl cis-trans isomerase B (cyclophilin B)